MSIRVKVLISMMAAFLAVTLFLGGFMYTRFDEMLIEQVKSDISGVVIENRNRFDNITMGIGRSFSSIGFNEYIIDAINDTGYSKTGYSAGRSLILSECRSIFELSLGSYVSGYALHFYINEDKAAAQTYAGTSHYPMQNLDSGIYSTEYIKNENWYKETLKSNASWYVFGVEENPEYVFFAKAIYQNNVYDDNPESYLGMGVVGINCRRLMMEMEKRAIPNAETVAILDNENDIVCVNQSGVQESFVKETAKNCKLGFNMTDEYETKDYVVNMARTNAGITFVSIATKDGIYLQTKHIRMVVVFSFVAALLIAFLLIFIISYYLTRPIKRLSGHMRSIDYENLSFSHLDATSRDEVGELYKAFNTMMDKIQQSRERENEQNEKNRRIEIQMLQAQINPHFLYNVLDSISWLAMENNQDGIGEMADLLSQLFAYSIKDGKIMATLGEELESVKKYVALQKNRYADNICLEVNIEKECMETPMPKCILQPLVENSIVHGMLDSEEGIVIRIHVQKKENFVEILVEDNGEGCDINIINALLDGKDTEITKYHLGIKNVSTRLRQVYRNESKLIYIKNPGRGITAKIILPGETEKDN